MKKEKLTSHYVKKEFDYTAEELKSQTADEILNEFYSNHCVEDTRFDAQSHIIEFITTMKYIERYLFKGAKILEIGAATGKYSIGLAKMGYEVTAVELVKSNIDVMNTNIKKAKLKNIKTIQGNALDLSILKNEEFDLVLNFGPMYHMYTQKDKDTVIDETLRLTKKGGIAFFAYVTNFSVLWNYGVRKGKMKELKYAIEEDFEIRDIKEEVFSVHSVEKFDALFHKKPIKKLHVVATDGIFENMRDYVNELDKEDFEILKNYHLAVCEKPSMLGSTSHGLWIGKKV